MTCARLWIAVVVFVAALAHLFVTVEGIRSHWVGLVSLVLLVGTFAMVVMQFRGAQDA